MKKAPQAVQPDDSEASSTKEKGKAAPATNGKGRRVASSAVNANTSGANSTLVASGSTAAAAGGTNVDGNVGVWNTITIPGNEA